MCRNLSDTVWYPSYRGGSAIPFIVGAGQTNCSKNVGADPQHESATLLRRSRPALACELTGTTGLAALVHAMDPEFHRHEERSSRLRGTPTGMTSGTGWLGTGPPLAKQGPDAPPFATALLAGGCASAAVDVAIFPLDTIKTRLQAPAGFQAAGGFHGLFRGVTAAAVGAAPGGALFFGTYEYSRKLLNDRQQSSNDAESGFPIWATDATAACIGAIARWPQRTAHTCQISLPPTHA